VAFFTDSYYEANGVARTSGALEAYAAGHHLPFLIVHGGRTTRLIESDSVIRLELCRAEATSVNLEHDLRFDVAHWRHVPRVAEVLREFRPDVIHLTGPSDVGQLGAYLGFRMRIPIVGSWHTNLHEYASRRMDRLLTWVPALPRTVMHRWVERLTLAILTVLYRIPRVILAPNPEWVRALGRRTGRPTFLMTRGIDTDLFTPMRRSRSDDSVNIGYVGRLSPEKNVRMLAALETAVVAAGRANVRFTIVGDGKEREFLNRTMKLATFPGTLRGESLADAYANLDLFVFPSETETVGNVVLEAMASGVPVIAMNRGGHRFIVDERAAILVETQEEFIRAVIDLCADDVRRRKMGRAGRALALERSWDVVFRDVYRSYAVALARAQRELPSVDEALVSATGKPPLA
jgi:glycosyltransferase involved in cell wall biosynthesis